MKIGKYDVDIGKPVYVVAEAGINHNGNVEIAKEMIESSGNCGVNAIKFQTIIPEELFSETLNPEWYNLCKKWSFTKKQHVELKKHAQKNGLEFFSTPLGKKSTKLLYDIGVKTMKIASGEVTNHELIKTVAKLKLPMIISTGMTMISEIASVVEIVEKENCPFILLHCNSSYPTPIEDANLFTINFLQKAFGVPVGYSDHSIGNEVCLAAVSLGACMIEKHFTLNKKMEGPDQKLSSDPKEFSELVSKIRMIEKSLGTPRHGPTKSEEKFKNLMRKSIGTSTNIQSGTKIKKSMLSVFRPGTGISPIFLDTIVGMTINKNVKKGTLLLWDMF